MNFRLISARYEGRLIPLSMDEPNDKKKENYYTILIGRNGTGKSRMLSEICRAFDAFDSEITTQYRKKNVTKQTNTLSRRLELFYSLGCSKPFHLFYNGNSNNVISADKYNDLHPPRRVIATTITPFDKFPIGKKRISKENQFEKDRTSIYRYLGSKNDIGQLSGTGQISRVIESLMFASEKSRSELVKLNKVFDFLKYHPTVAIDYDFRFRKHALEQMSLFDTGGDTDEFCRALGVDLRQRYSFNAELSKNNDFLNQLREAMKSVSNTTHYERKCTIEYDFESGVFKSGSLDIFRHVLFLRKYGLLSFADLRMVKLEQNQEISIRDASSGEQAVVLTFLGIASEIEDSSLVIIDEPEISLHPEWQEKFIELLRSTFNGYQGCHFILATHSPLLLSRIDGESCSVVTMDDLSITPAKELSRKSADYQLAEAFGTPGYRNEYLAREGLSALRLANHRKYDSAEFKEKIALLSRLRTQLHNDDPIALMTDALVEAAKEVSQ